MEEVVQEEVVQEEVPAPAEISDTNTSTLDNPQIYMLTLSADNKALLDPGSEAFTIDNQNRLVTRIPLPANTLIPIAYRHASFDKIQLRRIHSRRYIRSPEGLLLKVYGPEQSSRYVGALIFDALHLPDESTCKWLPIFMGDHASLCLNADAEAGSICII